MPVTLICSNCEKPFSVSPSRRDARGVHTCSRACRYAYQKSHPSPKKFKWRGHTNADRVVPVRTRSVYVERECAFCGRPLCMTEQMAARKQHTFCCSDHYYAWKQDWFSTYRARGLESSPRAMLVRYLIAHAVDEDLVIKAKDGQYITGTYDNPSSLQDLAAILQERGHTFLAEQVRTFEFLDESSWLLYTGRLHKLGPQIEPHICMPWEGYSD